MAINSVAYNGSQTYTAMTNITMSHNTVLAAWGGKGIGVYGGSGHLVEDNYLADTARYIGLGVGRFGVNGSDMTGATVSGNVIVRARRQRLLPGTARAADRQRRRRPEHRHRQQRHRDRQHRSSIRSTTASASPPPPTPPWPTTRSPTHGATAS